MLPFTSTDPLDRVLQTLQPRGAFYHHSEMHGAWGVAVPAGAATFHVVLEGTCTLAVGDRTETLREGDVAMLPHGTGHTLSDEPGRPTTTIEAMRDRYGMPGGMHVRKLGAGSRVALVCGGIAFDDAVLHPLIEALPPLLIVRGGTQEAVPWLPHTLGFLACEARSGRPGAETVMGHLASVLFIHAVRAHLDERDAPTSWLRALRDPHLGPALTALQAEPGASWTVAVLADVAGLSRSAFAARFRAAVGEPPMQFVTRWRMVRAAQLLRRERLGIADVAARVGYESEAAFNRAFKRWTSHTPGAYRATAGPNEKSGAADSTAAPLEWAA